MAEKKSRPTCIGCAEEGERDDASVRYVGCGCGQEQQWTGGFSILGHNSSVTCTCEDQQCGKLG